ncbi:hypothetical protein QUB05_16390 [Microcoleus sp. F10-C6]|uniref:hypothetical protein n=1 Tax=unclassified Microcoleus TaxID=2642155 RepID=UPI002FD75790
MISIPECTDFDATFGCGPTIDCCWGKLYVSTEILHDNQLAFMNRQDACSTKDKFSRFTGRKACC